MKYDGELTLLTENQAKESEIFKNAIIKPEITDFALLTGGKFELQSIKNEISNPYLTRTYDNDGKVKVMYSYDDWCKVPVLYSYYSIASESVSNRYNIIRPVLLFSSICHSPNAVVGKSGVKEVEYEEYPQQVVANGSIIYLENAYKYGEMKKTGKIYTTDSANSRNSDADFEPQQYEEYEYDGRKYVRVEANIYNAKAVNICDDDIYGSNVATVRLSDGVPVMTGDIVWVKVQPIVWLIDDEMNFAIAKKGILSGIRFDKKRGEWKGDFESTEMNMFLQTYLKKEIVETKIIKIAPEEKKQYEEKQKELEKRRNQYELNFGQVSEEDIIKGAIESGVAVFLHSASSEDKSIIVKQIDPTCETIYLQNASCESLNGKNICNEATGEMIDVKPSWLKQIEEKCEKEPDRYHIVFLDEITNALPNIQEIVFNMVLDRKVNGKWNLPENVRIIASGNDMNDNLVDTKFAESLFDSFAHVYIKPTFWLKWASDHNIHPAISSYIAYKKGETLRSEYNGEKPNADLRKWEMASKMLYATGKPEMLRALVGEDITREFIQFCNQRVITLDDVISDNATESDIQSLNTAERYATTMILSQVNDTDLEKVRGFVVEMGVEFGVLFDALWTHGDESRLERIEEVKLATGEVCKGKCLVKKVNY